MTAVRVACVATAHFDRSSCVLCVGWRSFSDVHLIYVNRRPLSRLLHYYYYLYYLYYSHYCYCYYYCGAAGA